MFHSDYIVPAARQEVVTNMNLLKFLLLPRRELGGRVFYVLWYILGWLFICEQYMRQPLSLLT